MSPSYIMNRSPTAVLTDDDSEIGRDRRELTDHHKPVHERSLSDQDPVLAAPSNQLGQIVEERRRCPDDAALDAQRVSGESVAVRSRCRDRTRSKKSSGTSSRLPTMLASNTSSCS